MFFVHFLLCGNVCVCVCACVCVCVCVYVCECLCTYVLISHTNELVVVWPRGDVVCNGESALVIVNTLTHAVCACVSVCVHMCTHPFTHALP
jgi:hypothetical protein